MNTSQFYAGASDRALVLAGMPADATYRFGVQAYRKVDADIDPTGLILSPITYHAPYKPANVPAFRGDLQGTIQGRGSLLVIQNVEAVVSDAILSTAEKPALIVEFNNNMARFNAAMMATTGTLVIEVANARTAAQTAITALSQYLSGLTPAWNDTAQHTAIDPEAFQNAWAGFSVALSDFETSVTHNLYQSLSLSDDGRLVYQPMPGGPAVDLGQVTPGGIGADQTVIAYISPNYASLWAFASGRIRDYTQAKGVVNVHAGLSDITQHFTLSVSSNPQNLTVLITGNSFQITGGFDDSEANAAVGIRATGTGRYSGVILDNVFTLSKMSGGYEILGALPPNNDPNNFEGRIVFVEEDQRLYTFRNGNWAGVVDDLTELDGAKIREETLEATAFARSIEPVTLATTLPTTKSTTFIGFEGKLYRWDAEAEEYVATVDAADLVGQISPVNIPDYSIDIDKFKAGIQPIKVATDTLPSSRSVDVIIFAGEIYRWDYTNDRYTNAVNAENLLGEIAVENIPDYSIDQSKFAAGVEPILVFNGDTPPVTKGSEVIVFNGEVYRWDATTGAYTAAIDASKITGVINPEVIPDNSIDIEKFKAGIQPVQIVTTGTVPTTKGAEVIVHDGVLYRWDAGASKYSAAVGADEIVGKIDPVNIPDHFIDESKFAPGVEPVLVFTGDELPEEKGSRVIVFNGEVYRWDAEAGSYTAAIDAANITGTINPEVIPDNSIDIEKFKADLQPVQVIPTGPLPTVKTANVIIHDDQIYRWDAEAEEYIATVFAENLVGEINPVNIPDGGIDIGKFAEGIEPVQIFTTGNLPTVKGSEVIVHDGTVYRWNDGAYTSTVQGADIVGTIPAISIPNNSIDASKFATGVEPVTIVGSGNLPTSKLTTYISYGGKLYRWNGTAYKSEVAGPDVIGTIPAVAIPDLSIDMAKFADGIEPVKIITGAALPTMKVASTVFFQAKLYRWDGTKYTAEVAGFDVDGRGLQILDDEGVPLFGSDGTIGDGAFIRDGVGNQIFLSEVATNALTPSLHYVGEYENQPTPAMLGDKWRQNAVYKSLQNGDSYVLTGDPLVWILYLESGTSFDLRIESSHGTTFRVGQSSQTTLKARVFKNGAEVTDETPSGWFRWRRQSAIIQQAPNDDQSWNNLYQAGYKQVTIGVDDVYARATFFCDLVST